jgi:MtaA/CmuA family methyltransferase
MTPKEAYRAVLAGEKAESLPFAPITMMFASDLVGRPYREYATDYRVMTRGQIAVAERFSTSIVSAISDPCVEAADLGADCAFPEDAPPAVREDSALLARKRDLGSLHVVEPSAGRRMANRVRAVGALSNSVGDDLMVEGWIEGPCAEAADLRGLNRLMMDFYDDPEFVSELMDFVVEQERGFALAQVEAGADIIGIGDAASSLIGGELYGAFVAARTKRLVDAIGEAGAAVRLHICGSIMGVLDHLAALEVDQLDVDSMNPLADVRNAVGDRPVLCGNLDPVRVVRDAAPASISEALRRCLADSEPSYIVGAGCEIPRDTPHENLAAMAEFAATA